MEVMPKGEVDKPVDSWRDSMLKHMNAVCTV